MSQQETKDMAKHFYRASAADFQKIPGGAVAYWLSPSMLSVFDSCESLSEHCAIREGINTGDNERFLRKWPEVSIKTFCHPSEQADSHGFKWFAHRKGGEFRKWFGNRDYVVNWEHDGEDIHQFHNLPLDYNGAPVRGKAYFFHSGLSWSRISSGSFALRYYEAGMTYDSTAPSIFANQKDALAILGLLNSRVVFRLLEALSPTLDFRITSLGRLPFIPADLLFDKPNDRFPSERLIDISRLDWDSYEASWDFTGSPFLQSRFLKPSLNEAYIEIRAYWREMTLEMQRLEEANNSIFIGAYRLLDELSSDVPLEEITLFCNPYYRYGKNNSKDELETFLQSDTFKELVSYAVGCMMGRYSMNKPGLILASQDETLEDYLHQIPTPRFAPDDDAILPLTNQEWFPDDATNRVREFVREGWGDGQLQENLDFVAESLCLHAIKPKRGESALDTIRRYLSTQFFKDHLRTYKKRPIYWLFSSGKHKAFECLVYLHRYNEGTLARMRTEYVIPLSAKLNAYAEKLEQDKDASTSAAETKRLEKEISTVYKQQTELTEFDEKLRHYADQRISLDLDDGVKVNYGKFGDLLAEVKSVTGENPTKR
jgi:type II restriction/modification system DNA methylase subunit YeeA